MDLHAEAVERFGGMAGVRERGLLESAVAMPMAGFGGEFLHVGLAAMAVAYLFHLIKAHPFVDGNKRTGCLAAMVFLDANGISHRIQGRDLERIAVAVAAGELDKEGVTAWFGRQLTRR